MIFGIWIFSHVPSMICFTRCAWDVSPDAASLRCTQMSGNWQLASIGSGRFNPRFIRERIHTGLVVSSLLACYGSGWILFDDLTLLRLRSQRLRSHRSDSRFGSILNSADSSATWLRTVGNGDEIGWNQDEIGWNRDEIGWKISKEGRSSMPSRPEIRMVFPLKLCTDAALIAGRGVHGFPSRSPCHA